LDYELRAARQYNSLVLAKSHRGVAAPKIFGVRCDGILRLGESFGRMITANHCESPPLIRSFLIDFALPNAFRAVVCAKFFPRADVLVANNVNIERDARSAKISWPKQV
jgi:hypothetical protein